MASNPLSPRISTRQEADGVVVVEIAGQWKEMEGLPDSAELQAVFEGGNIPRALTFDAQHLGEWDLRLVNRLVVCVDLAEKAQVKVDPGGLPEGIRSLIHLARVVPSQKDAAGEHIERSWLYQVGEAAQGSVRRSQEALAFVGNSVLAFGNLLRGRARFRWSDTLVIMQECGPEALGVVTLINFLVGLILGFVGVVQLARFGASIYVADLVGIATTREMAAIMTGIIMCGRTGAAFAARLGTMKVNEEIDSLTTFGFPAVEFLVLPRIIALCVMMPLLVAYADLIGILGGGFAVMATMDLTATEYFGRTISTVSITNFSIGIVKGCVFGIIVALTGCLRGMQCGSNAAEVGLATTSAVVTGITWIIACDAVFAVVCQAFGI